MQSITAPHVEKKAAHVKWAGKTIALGTFPTAEADDKCISAKALTRAWRSTMRPKPCREWVMLELERLNVRVVVTGHITVYDSTDSDSDDEVHEIPRVSSRDLSSNEQHSNRSDCNSIDTSNRTIMKLNQQQQKEQKMQRQQVQQQKQQEQQKQLQQQLHHHHQQAQQQHKQQQQQTHQQQRDHQLKQQNQQQQQQQQQQTQQHQQQQQVQQQQQTHQQQRDQQLKQQNDHQRRQQHEQHQRQQKQQHEHHQRQQQQQVQQHKQQQVQQHKHQQQPQHHQQINHQQINHQHHQQQQQHQQHPQQHNQQQHQRHQHHQQHKQQRRPQNNQQQQQQQPQQQQHKQPQQQLHQQQLHQQQHHQQQQQRQQHPQQQLPPQQHPPQQHPQQHPPPQQQHPPQQQQQQQQLHQQHQKGTSHIRSGAVHALDEYHKKQQLADRDLLNVNRHRQKSATASLLNIVDLVRGDEQQNGMASPSLAPKINHTIRSPERTDNTVVEKRVIPTNTRVSPHRTFVRGGSATAHVDTEEDHYRRVAQQRQLQNKDGGTRDSAVPVDGTLAAGGLPNNAAANLGTLGPIERTLGKRTMNQQANLDSNARNLPPKDSQHFEMLKSHHMNLINELQETTLMMKIYQKQHLEQDLQQEEINKNKLVEPQPSLLTQPPQQLVAGDISQPGGGLAQVTDESLALTYRRTDTANSSNGSNHIIVNHRIKNVISNAIDNNNNTAANSAPDPTSSPGRPFLSRRTNTANSSNGSNHIIVNHRIKTVLSNPIDNNNNTAANSAPDLASSPARTFLSRRNSSNHNTIINHRIKNVLSNPIDNNNNTAVNSAPDLNSSPGRTFLSRRTNTANNSNHNTIINHRIENVVSNPIDNNNNTAVDITGSPDRTILSSVNNTTCHRESNRIDSHEDSTSIENLFGDELQRIKDEIAERQRMVDLLEMMKPNQKRPKIEKLM